MSARRLVSRVALDEWLTAEIHKVPGCENCTLASKYVVGEPGKNNGCNWAGLTIRLGEGAVVQAVAKAALAIEQRASLLFNLDTATPRLRVEGVMVPMSRRLLYIPAFRLDADLAGDLRGLPGVRQLEKWREDGVILLDMPAVADDTARTGLARDRQAMSPGREREARADRRHSLADEDVIFVRGTPCDAIERHATPAAGDDLRQPRANTLSVSEAVAYVRRQIARRDAVNAEIAEATGQALPDWTGRD
jgi:hypothetical protein